MTASICLPARVAAPQRRAARRAPAAASSRSSAFAGVALPVRAVQTRRVRGVLRAAWGAAADGQAPQVVARAAKAEQSFDTEEVIKTLQEKVRAAIFVTVAGDRVRCAAGCVCRAARRASSRVPSRLPIRP